MSKIQAALAAAAFLALTPATPGAAPTVVRVLFVGNSLTYQNNLPAMIEAIAVQAGAGSRVFCRGVAKPNFGLEDHWRDGEAVRGIQEGHWTHVVLQQGPSSLPESEASLREYARRFAVEARRRRAAVVLYSVWPSQARAASFDAVLASYGHAAQDAGGSVVAVGEGWRAAWRRDASLSLYGPDGFHPSPVGTYLAALMFLERLAGISPVGLPGPETSQSPVLRAVRLDAAQLKAVQEAAAEEGVR